MSSGSEPRGHAAGSLDAPTLALVRIAAATATGDEAKLRERMIAARAAEVPPLWVEELLLQSFLNVGYPLALVAFGVWRSVDGARRPSLRRSLRADVPQADAESAGVASGDRAARGGRCVWEDPWKAGAGFETTGALYAGGDCHAKRTATITRAPARRVEHGVNAGRGRRGHCNRGRRSDEGPSFEALGNVG